MFIEDYELPLEKGVSGAWWIYKQRVLWVSILAFAGIVASSVISFPISSLCFFAVSVIGLLILTASVPTLLHNCFYLITRWVQRNTREDENSLSPTELILPSFLESIEAMIGDFLERREEMMSKGFSRAFLSFYSIVGLLSILLAFAQISLQHLIYEALRRSDSSFQERVLTNKKTKTE